MVKKKVKICDICKKIIAVSKCFICKKDLCDECKKILKVDLVDEDKCYTNLISPLNICGECNSIIRQIDFKDKEINKEITNIIKPYLTKKMILNNLEDKPKGQIGKLGIPIAIAISGTSAFVGIAQTDAKKGQMVTVRI